MSSFSFHDNLADSRHIDYQTKMLTKLLIAKYALEFTSDHEAIRNISLMNQSEDYDETEKLEDVILALTLFKVDFVYADNVITLFFHQMSELENDTIKIKLKTLFDSERYDSDAVSCNWLDSKTLQYVIEDSYLLCVPSFVSNLYKLKKAMCLKEVL